MPLPERALVEEIRRMAAPSAGPRKTAGRVVVGIGDDCAVLRPGSGHDLLVTTDFTLEGVHFRRDWHPPAAVGHRCLARGLSDLAAMGGEPLAAFLSLALPPDISQDWARKFMGGLVRLARRYRVRLAGGDTAESPAGILADIIVVGAVPKGRAVRRSGARPGDAIYVSGTLGGSAAAVRQMQAHPEEKQKPLEYARHFYPEPRIELGRLLGNQKLASAMIDTSDGLSTDLSHLCEQSGVGAEIELSSIPLATVGRPPRPIAPELALHGGEDYELLFTVRRGKAVSPKMAGVPLTCIGKIRAGKSVLLKHPDGSRQPFEPRGWEHFAK